MGNEKVEQAAAAVAVEITSQIDAALAATGEVARQSFELLAASRGLDAEAAALGDAAEVQARVDRLRAQLAQLSDPIALAEQRRVMLRVAERLRRAAEGGAAG